MLTTSSERQYEDEIDLLRYGRFLAAYRIVLLTCMIAGVIVAWAIRSRAPVKYQATATMAVNPNAKAGAALTAATSRALLANLTLVAETIHDVQLDTDGWTPQAFMDDALELQSVPSTNLLRVIVRVSDPTKARLAANALASKAVELARRLDQEGALSGRDAIKKQMDEAALRLDQVQDRLVTFKSSAQVDMLKAQTESRLDRRRRMSDVAIELERERARLGNLEGEIAGHRMASEVPRPGSAPPPTDTRRGKPATAGQPPRDMGSPLATSVSGMLQYEVAESRARVAALEKERVETLALTGGAGAVKDLSELYRREIELSRLEADYEVSKQVYSDLATKYEEARSQVVGVIPQLQIVDAPVQPDRPLSRRLLQVGIVGALAGLVVGVVASILLNRRRAMLAIN